MHQYNAISVETVRSRTRPTSAAGDAVDAVAEELDCEAALGHVPEEDLVLVAFEAPLPGPVVVVTSVGVCGGVVWSASRETKGGQKQTDLQNRIRNVVVVTSVGVCEPGPGLLRAWGGVWSASARKTTVSEMWMIWTEGGYPGR